MLFLVGVRAATVCVCQPKGRACAAKSKTLAVARKTDDAQIKCVTEHDGFAPNFLNHHVMELAVYEFNCTDGPIDDNDEIHK